MTHKRILLKSVLEKEKMLLTSFFSFPVIVFFSVRDKFCHFELAVIYCLQMLSIWMKPKFVVHFSKELIMLIDFSFWLDWKKFYLCYFFYIITLSKKPFENIGYQYFLLFPQCFQQHQRQKSSV